MATAARFAAEAADAESEEWKLATEKAKRYESLAVSEDYTDTFLEHPFLRKAVLDAQKRKTERHAQDGTKTSKRRKCEKTGAKRRVDSKGAERRKSGKRKRDRAQA
jgi:hypothetical protein